MSARVRRRRTLVVVVLLVAAVAWTTALRRPDQATDVRPASARSGQPVAGSTPTGSGTPGAGSSPAAGTAADRADIGQVAALGPRTAATLPVHTTEAVVVRGDGPDAVGATIELYQRTGTQWRRTHSWRGHVGASGWTADHHEGDLRTPAGTFTLSDAGGLREDPGTRLPYHQSEKFVPSGDSVFGDSLEGSFDYVLAVDFNRRTGRSPLDTARPEGQGKGGGIWLHVDHDGPTHGCVSVPESGMRDLLRALSPSAHPMVVMGDRARLLL